MRRVNRNVELLQNIRQRAEVIFVSVREDDGSDVLPVLFEKIEIGNADIDAVDALFGKAHARVEHEHLVAVAQQPCSSSRTRRYRRAE